MKHEMPVEAEPGDDIGFYRYKDLVDLRIVTNRNDLHRKQKALGFPKAVKLTPGQGAVALFPRAKVREWIRRRLEAAGQEE